MHTLITGINGFVGGHLAEHLLALGGASVWGVTRTPTLILPTLRDAVQVVQADLCDPAQVAAAIAAATPDVIIHLAGQTFVPESFRDPATTLHTNSLALLHLVLALLEQQRACRVLVVGSNEEYGLVTPADIPIDEATPLRPASPYGVSKITQSMLALQYHRSHNLDIVVVRPFNHIGPRQDERFVTSAFAKQIVQIEKGLQPPLLQVGNLDVQRDFTDVRDMVRAYALAIQHGAAGQIYNLGSGQPVAIRTLLDMLAAASTATFEIQPDPTRMRPVNVPVVACDARRFATLTGWQPRIPLEQTLHDILADWRTRVPDTATA
ncbi:MAG: NAD-dependent epimerase/dehydratase family protein [Chloroflexaceae bacterium]|nr:NAD-dependent epimerase/dehydratase family protein [Chloroflexaceae bacterium]NJO06508.1 NAD-dependent epimerase/dehydratase family protein [Chloroflexaceae bacterium]